MRHFFFLVLLCLSNVLYSQTTSFIIMSDQKKFAEAYDSLKALVKTNPALMLLLSAADKALLQAAKQAYQDITAAETQPQAVAVAYTTKGMPDPIPDDDDPNTIKKKEFVAVMLTHIRELSKSIGSSELQSNTTKISLSFIQNFACNTIKPRTPIGAAHWDAIAGLAQDDKNNTIGTFAASFATLIDKTYKENQLRAHYKANQPAYMTKGIKAGEVDVTNIFLDIPTDSSFLIAAAKAYKEQNEFPSIIHNFISGLSSRLSKMDRNSLVQAKDVFKNWKTSLSFAPDFAFKPLFDALGKLDGLRSIDEVHRTIADVRKNCYSDEKLKEMAAQCTDCSFIYRLPDLDVLAHQINNSLTGDNAHRTSIKDWINKNSPAVTNAIGDDHIMLLGVLKLTLINQAHQWKAQPLPVAITNELLKSINSNTENMTKLDVLKKLSEALETCVDDIKIIELQIEALEGSLNNLNADLSNLIKLINGADSVALQERFVELWLQRQKDWRDAVSGTQKGQDIKKFSIAKIKSLKPQFDVFDSVATFWFDGFMNNLPQPKKNDGNKPSPDEISTLELINAIEQSFKQTEDLKNKFLDHLKSQKANIQGFIDSLGIMLPRPDIFLSAAKYNLKTIDVTVNQLSSSDDNQKDIITNKHIVCSVAIQDTKGVYIRTEVAVPFVSIQTVINKEKKVMLQPNGDKVIATVQSTRNVKCEDPKIGAITHLNPVENGIFDTLIAISLPVEFPTITITKEEGGTKDEDKQWLINGGAAGVVGGVILGSNPAGWVVAGVGLGLIALSAYISANTKTIAVGESREITLTDTLNFVLRVRCAYAYSLENHINCEFFDATLGKINGNMTTTTRLEQEATIRIESSIGKSFNVKP